MNLEEDDDSDISQDQDDRQKRKTSTDSSHLKPDHTTERTVKSDKKSDTDRKSKKSTGKGGGYILEDDNEKQESNEPISSTLIQHELNFFEFETKMRKFMYDIIEPNTKRVNIQNAQLVDLDRELKKANLEIQELQAFLFKGKSKNKQSTLDEIYIKIADIEKDRKMEEANMMFELHKFDKKLNDMDFNYKASKEENSLLRGRIKANEDNIFKFNENMKSLKEAFLLKLSETYDKLFGQIENIQKIAQTADRQSKVNKAKINTMDAQVQSDRKQIDSQSSNHIKLESRVEKINQVTVKEQKYKEDIAKIEENIKKLEVKEEDFTNHLATIENYVEKYMPTQIQMQIGDAFKGILPKKELRKFDHLQREIFEKLYKVILSDDGSPDILSKIKQTKNLINNIEFHSPGQSYGMNMTGQSPSKSDHVGEASPHKSDNSGNSFSKSLTKKGTEFDSKVKLMRSKYNQDRRHKKSTVISDYHPIENRLNSVDKNSSLKQSSHQNLRDDPSRVSMESLKQDDMFDHEQSEGESIFGETNSKPRKNTEVESKKAQEPDQNNQK